MPETLLVIFAAFFTYAVCLLAGKLILRTMPIELYRSEEWFLGFIVGAATLSIIVFALTALRCAYATVFVCVGMAITGCAVLLRAHRFTERTLPRVPRFWRLLFVTVYAPYAVVYFINALAPESSPDGTAYHVALVSKYLREHAFSTITTDMYAALSQGIEMLFLFAFSIGRHSAAGMVHLLFLLTLPFGMVSWARRRGYPVMGVIGALLFLLSPVVARTGTVAYVDVALASILFCLFYAIDIWILERQRGLLVLIGMLAGFSYATKYTGIIAIPYAIAVIAWHSRSRGLWRRITVVAGFAALMMLPWLVKNQITFGNPVAPFGNRMFPNPYFYVAAEENYARTLRHFSQVSYLEIPLEVTVRGERLRGFVGPIFLLAPLMFVALRWPIGRKLILAFVFFVASYFLNTGTRFLVPALPFGALAIGMVCGRFLPLGFAVVVIHMILSWPWLASYYCSPYAWRIAKFPWEAALRITPEAEYLRRQMNDYDLGLQLETHVPKGDLIFSIMAPQKAYHSRDVVIAYESALGNRVQDIFWTPAFKHLQPQSDHGFHFNAVRTRRFRIVQAGGQTTTNDSWSINEVVFFYMNHRVSIPSTAHFLAAPNHWDAKYAFDGNDATRWSSQQAFTPGMYIEVDFETSLLIDQVAVACTQDQWMSKLRLEYFSADGHALRIPADAVITNTEVSNTLRQSAAAALKTQGIKWILLGQQDYGARDFEEHAIQWNAQKVFSLNDSTLYCLR